MSNKDKNVINYKKLPGMFKKTYREAKFDKKILKHIYIPADREFITSFFETKTDKKNRPVLCIDKTRIFEKKEIKRFKTLAKEIKSHKGRIKWVPFVAVISFVAVVFMTVIGFKNVIAKKALKNGCEALFEAKTDVSSVKVSFLDSRITVSGLQVGNKDSEFKNIFEIGKIDLDFNLTEALKGKFIAENLECRGMLFNTDRTESCRLPEKQSKEKKSKEKSTEQTIKENKFFESLNKQQSKAVNQLQGEMFSILGGSNVETIAASMMEKLNTPAAVEGAINDTVTMIQKWEKKPAEIEKQVTDFYNSVIDLTKIEIKGNPNINEIKSAIEKVTKAINTGNEIKVQVETIVNDVKSDVDTVMNVKDSITVSITNDMAFATDMFTSIKGMEKTAMSIFTSGLDSLGYDLLGKYYPYVTQGITYAVNYKQNSKTASNDNIIIKLLKAKKTKNKEKKAKKSKRARMSGRTIDYSNQYPSLLIKRAFVSGDVFEAELNEVASNPNIRNKPASLKLKLNLFEIEHSGNLIVDARTNSSGPLISVEYKGSGYKTNIDGSGIAVKQGVPSISGTSVISLTGKADEGYFEAGGNIEINPLYITSDGFDNELITRYYLKALHSVDNLDMGYTVLYKDLDGLRINLTGNFGTQFVKAITEVAKSIGMDAKNAALRYVNAQLNGMNEEVLAVIKKFTGIQGEIDVQNIRVDSIQKMLNDKVHEMQNFMNNIGEQIQKQADEAAAKFQEQAEATALELQKQTEAAALEAQKKAEEAAAQAQKQAEEAAQKAAEDAMNQAKKQTEEAAAQAMKNIFSNFKKQ